MAAALGEAGRRGGLVVDVDAVVRPFDRGRAGRGAEETGEAGGEEQRGETDTRSEGMVTCNKALNRTVPANAISM